MQPIFNDDNLMLKLNVVHKLRKVLQREGSGYKNKLHRRWGVGLSEADFEYCVRMLVLSDWVTVSEGERGALILTLNEQFRNTHQGVEQ